MVDSEAIGSIGARLKTAMDARGVTIAGLAGGVGLSYQGVRKIVLGGTKTMDAANSWKIASFLRINPAWLATGKGAMTDRSVDEPPGFGTLGILQVMHHIHEPKAPFDHAGPVRPAKGVPVTGLVKLDDDGHFEEVGDLPPGAESGTLLAYSGDPQAYGLKFRGNSLYPAIKDGWYGVIEPNARLSPGEYVLIKLRNGTKMVKELLYERPDAITVMDVNGGSSFAVARDDVECVQAVGSIVPPSKWHP